MATQVETVPSLVTLGHVGEGAFVLRFLVEYSEEIFALLDEAKVSHNTALELSADQPLWLEVVEELALPGALPAGLTAIASVIKTIVKRHAGKRFILKQGELEIQADGYSEKTVERFFQRRVRDQAELDTETRRVLGLRLEGSVE